MTLDMGKRGQNLRIASIPNQLIKSQAIRFGIMEGEWVVCEDVIPAGPVIIRKNMQQLALGRKLAREITVTEA